MLKNYFSAHGNATRIAALCFVFFGLMQVPSAVAQVTTTTTTCSVSADAGPDLVICPGGNAVLNASCSASSTTTTSTVAASSTSVYSTNVPVAHGWTFSDARWSRVATNLAGGAAAGEFRFQYSSTATASFTAISPLIAATGFSGMTLSFRHATNNYNATTYPYTLSLQTSVDGVTWTNRWSVTPTGTASIAPVTVSGIDLSALSGTNFYIRFNFTGNTFGINYWYADDISISGFATTSTSVVTPLTPSYSWNPVATMTSGSTTLTPTAAPTATTNYMLTVNAGSCSKTDTAVVAVVMMNVNAGPDIGLCSGSTGVLTATATTTPSAVVSTTSAQVYNTQVPVAHGWTFSDARWTRQTTNTAGGAAGEFRFYYSASATGTYTATSPLITAMSYSGLAMSFKHSVNNFNGASYPYTLSVQTSPDGVTWTTRWTISPTASIAAATVNGVDLTALNGTSFYLRLNFTGQELGINGWYVDDINISGYSTIFVNTSYAWTPAATVTSGATMLTPVVAPSATTNYVLTSTAAGCTARDTIKVSILSVNAGLDKTICRGNNLTLNGSISTPTIQVPSTTTTTNTSSGAVYSTQVPVSHGWTFSDTRWTRQTTNLAGGTAGEFRFYYSASATGTYTATSPAITANTSTGLTLSFKHYLYNYNASTYPYTISVQTSTDGVTWTNRWSVTPTGTTSIAATTVSGIDLSALNGTTFYLRLNFTGQEMGIFGWYVDDITVSGTTTTTTVTTTYPSVPVTFAWTPSGSVVSGLTTLAPVVAPVSTTTYLLTASAGSCTATDDIIVNLPSSSGILAAGGESATCMVKAGETVHFFNTSTGDYIAAVTAGPTDLGNTTATAYVDGAVDFVPACSNSSIETAVMQRHWVITPAIQGSATVRLPYSTTELNNLMPASIASTSPYDLVVNQASLKLSKYSGNNVDSDPDNNCPGAGGTGATVIIDETTLGSNPLAGVTALYSDFSITGFSEFWLHGSNNNSPLPVGLTSFTVNCEESDQLISWTTESESNCSHFDLERSRDGISWDVVATVSGNGSTSQVHQYASAQPLTGEITYFRLKQFDTDGSDELFGPVTGNCTDNSNILSVFPNPSAGSFRIAVSSTVRYPDMQVIITGIDGQPVTSRTTDIDEGVTQLYFDDLQLSPGTYIIAIPGQDNNFKPVRLVVL